MSNLINFTFENLPVRIIDLDNNHWFIANDVCAILEHSNTSEALKALDDDEKTKLEVSPKLNLALDNRVKEINIINESGLYALILRSRKAMQKGTIQHKFRKWVTSEVLPSIRKNGAYQQQNLAITHQSERPFNIGDYLNPKVNQIMDYVHDLEHIVFNTTGKYPQRPFKPDEIAKGIIGYCLRNQSIELSFSERGLGFNLVDRTMLRIHDSNIAEHIKNGNVKKQYLDEIIQASVARLA